MEKKTYQTSNHEAIFVIKAAVPDANPQAQRHGEETQYGEENGHAQDGGREALRLNMRGQARSSFLRGSHVRLVKCLALRQLSQKHAKGMQERMGIV